MRFITIHLTVHEVSQQAKVALFYAAVFEQETGSTNGDFGLLLTSAPVLMSTSWKVQGQTSRLCHHKALSADARL